jgi:hypothetical protein
MVHQIQIYLIRHQDSQIDHLHFSMLTKRKNILIISKIQKRSVKQKLHFGNVRLIIIVIEELEFYRRKKDSKWIFGRKI